jgi:hypothetical protein
MSVVYALHYGTRRNRFYGLYATKPTVTTRTVTDARSGRSVTLYESPDPLELNICVSGFERMFGVSLPLGDICKITFEVEDEC